MTDLNIVRIGSLKESDDGDREAPSYLYDSWRYVDEASLYSIAEDSREDRQSSRGTSSRTNSHMLSTAYGMEGEHETACPIEVRWVTAEEMEAEARVKGALAASPSSRGSNGDVAAAAAPAAVDLAEMSLEDEDNLGPRHNTRRSLLFMLLLLGCVGVVVISLALGLSNRNSRQPANSVSGGVMGEDFASPSSPAGSTVVAPTAAPSSSPATFPQDPREFVYKALATCPYTNLDDLTNTSKSQMEVFEELVFLVTSLTSVVDGKVVYDSRIGTDWVLELWALLMFYFESDGELWTHQSGWFSDADVCTWYNQASTPCQTRLPGGAALTKLKLSSNNLQGSLPIEICCMPLLDELVLNNNGLEGIEPKCVYEMGLSALVMTGNEFTQVAVQSWGLP